MVEYQYCKVSVDTTFLKYVCFVYVFEYGKKKFEQNLIEWITAIIFEDENGIWVSEDGLLNLQHNFYTAIRIIYVINHTNNQI